MLFASSTKNALVALPNFAANGSIGTAAATVDIADIITINQTTANIALTHINPTDLTAGGTKRFGNVGIVPVTLGGVKITNGFFQEFIWTGTTYLGDGGNRNLAATVLVASVPVGNSVVTHNLNLPTGSFNKFTFTAENATGVQIFFDKNLAGNTANAMGIKSTTALTNITFTIYPSI